MRLVIFVIACWVVTIFENSIQEVAFDLKVINKSNFRIDDIVIFSTKFKNLKRNESSNFKRVHYDRFRDDNMLFLSVNNDRLALYVIPIKNENKMTYVIDSIDLQKGLIFGRVSN